MSKSKTFVALDVGSYKTAAVIGDLDETGKLHIIGFGEALSKGIEKGSVVNPSEAIKSIKEAAVTAESNSGFRISSVVLNIGGVHIESKNEKDFISFSSSNKEIDQNDINALIEKISEKFKNDNIQILHIIPKMYVLDDDEIVYEPIGLVGSKISGEYNVITGKVNSISNIKKVVEQSGLGVMDIVVNPIASATSVLYEEEKDLSVAIIDIGGGLSDIAVYKNGYLEVVKSIPIGGNLITKDISFRFKISKDIAENLKKQHGLATTEFLEFNEVVEVKTREDEETIKLEKYEIVETIEWRLTEIFEILRKELEKTGLYDRLNAGIVLTGGVANTPYIQKLAENIFEKDVRIGKPKEFKAFNEKFYSPEYATVIGCLQFTASALKDKHAGSSSSSEMFSFNISDTFIKFFDKIKNLF
jgi:cell division protein FtsA